MRSLFWSGWLAAAIACVVPAGFTQTKAPAHKAPAAARWPIESLTVEGNRIYTAQQILAIAGLKAGQMAGRAEFDAARDRLVASGAFETVGYKFTGAVGAKGYSAVLQVNEIEQCYPVEFEELHVSEKDLRADLASRDPLFTAGRLPATQPVLDRYVKWIEAFLASHGAPDKIVGSVSPLRGNEFGIVFRPDRPLPAVSLVTFRGNSVIPSNVLHDAIAGAAIGTPYTEDRFRDVLSSSIRPLYEARGRVRVTFPDIRTEADKTVKGLHVWVTVDEGDSYNLGKVSIDGDSPIGAAELVRTAKLKSGDVANFDRVHQGIDEIRKAVTKTGHLQARVTFDRQIDDGHKSVDVAIHVDAGPQFTMGQLAVKGLDIEGENEIRHMWTMTSGKPFDPEYPNYFLDTVHKEGVFDHLGKTKADVRIDEKAHRADVSLSFAGDGGASAVGRRKR